MIRSSIDPSFTAAPFRFRTIRDSFLKLGARRSFVQLFAELRQALDAAEKHSGDVRDMLSASFVRLNAEFGFSLVVTAPPELARAILGG